MDKTRLVGAFLFLSALAMAQSPGSTSKEPGIHAFRDMAAVLTSPRCLNCHVAGDRPMQGDDSHVHNMRVERGPDGGGTPAMRCANCHQDSNVETPHGPPGVAGWRMPGTATPMTWQGLTTGQVCRSLTDPATNGKRSLADLLEHMTADHIVNWGWNPGPGRSLPPLSHSEFVERVRVWVEAGGPCPK